MGRTIYVINRVGPGRAGSVHVRNEFRMKNEELLSLKNFSTTIFKDFRWLFFFSHMTGEGAPFASLRSQSLIESYLNYCLLIFGNAYQTHLGKLEVAQKKCVRIIANENPYAHSDPIFSHLKLLKLSDRYKLNLGIYMYKNLDTFSRASDRHNYSTRFGDNNFPPVFQRLTLT